MMLFRKICNWFWYKKRRKLHKLHPEEFEKEIKRLFPSSETPFMELTKRLNTPGAIIPDPEIKMLGITEKDARFMETINELKKSLERKK